MIDVVLSRVAGAGKSYHNTDCWQDESDWGDGKSEQQRIQEEADASAKEITALESELEALKGAVRSAVQQVNQKDEVIERLRGVAEDMLAELLGIWEEYTPEEISLIERAEQALGQADGGRE